MITVKYQVCCENKECKIWGVAFNYFEQQFEDEKTMVLWEESYGHGAESSQDYCPFCKRLGLFDYVHKDGEGVWFNV